MSACSSSVYFITVFFSHVVVEPKHQERKEGSKAEFKCIDRGSKKMSAYSWFKDGTEMYGQNSSTLVLDCVELRDFGSYKCRVSFDNGKYVECSGELDVIPRDGMGECCLRHFSTK